MVRANGISLYIAGPMYQSESRKSSASWCTSLYQLINQSIHL